MGGFRRVGRVLPQLVATIVLSVGVIYFVFIYDVPAQPTRRALDPGGVSPTVEHRLATLEAAVETFEQKVQRAEAGGTASGWYAEKILRLITVVSIIGTLMTVFGYFSISNLKQSADDSKDAYERTKAQLDETYASVILISVDTPSRSWQGRRQSQSGRTSC